MLTQLNTVKSRLGIDPFDLQYDALLTNMIKAISARFDKECNRTLARTAGMTDEFPGDEVELLVNCYPIETITKFETKRSESEGWLEQTGVNYLIRRACVISLGSRLGTCRSQLRLTYTGGFVLPGTTAGAGQTALPDDLEQAAVEQVSAWFQNRDKLGLVRNWPKGGVYQEYTQTDLLVTVRAVLDRYVKCAL